MPTARVRLNERGRIVIPAEYRRELGLKEGDSLLLDLEADGIRMRTPEAAFDDAQAYVRARIKPGAMLLSDELIADRRAEAADE